MQLTLSLPKCQVLRIRNPGTSSHPTISGSHLAAFSEVLDLGVVTDDKLTFDS